MKVGMATMKDREEISAASVSCLMYSNYTYLAHFWIDMARLVVKKPAAGTSGETSYEARLQTARSYLQYVLPRTRAHVAAMLFSANNLMGTAEEDFAFDY